MADDLPIAGVKRKAAGMEGEAATSPATAAPVTALPSRPAASTATGDVFNEVYLRFFYSRLFPFKLLTRWLSYGNDADSRSDSPFLQRDFFNRREFCFTLADDVFVRYQCFRDAREFAAAVQARQPYKLDIGPVMSIKPSSHTVSKKMDCLERELVFDIDMDAYDSIRRCCKGATICAKCWAFVRAAVRTLDAVLRDDFGFKLILFIYSGRRGMHCWVADETARRMDNSARGALVDYLSVLNGSNADDADGSAGGGGGGAGAGAGGGRSGGA